MIAVLARQDLAFPCVPLGGAKEPQHFHHGVVRLGPRVGVKHLAALKRRHLDQLFAKHHGLVRHPPEKGVIAGEFVVLRLGSGGHAGVVEPRNHVPQARVRIQIASAMDVEHIWALAMGQNDRAALMHRGQVGKAVKAIGFGAGFPAVGGLVTHHSHPWSTRFSSRYSCAGAGAIGARHSDAPLGTKFTATGGFWHIDGTARYCAHAVMALA